MENYSILTTQEDLTKFQQENQDIEWLCIDTEFIGEKRYQTLLCLVQVATPNGLYIFDSIELPHIQPIIDLVVDPNILKISHAGENDYRLLFELYNITPKNVFDTQIAAGFVGYRYPISFRALVQAELNIRVNKVQTVTDWERRPMKKQQIDYALSDVIPLKELYDRLSNNINQLNRTDWVTEEMEKVEHIEFYKKDIYKEAFGHSLMPSLPLKEKIFLIRLFDWRRTLAESRNHSKEMVLAKKYITPIVKSIHLGKEGLKQNRRISERFVKRYGDEMVGLYQKPIKEEEKNLLSRIPPHSSIDPKEDLKMEMLYSFINYRCLEQKIAPELVFPRGLFKEMKEDVKLDSVVMEKGWRRKILGEEITNGLLNRGALKIEIKDGDMTLKATS